VALVGSGLAGTITRGFTFLGPAPHAIAFDVRGSPPAGGGSLRIRGLDIDASSTVTFGGIPATVTTFTPDVITGSGVLTVVVPPFTLAPGATDGFASVVVTNADGQSSTRTPDVSADGTPWPANFHYGPPPVVTGLSPSIIGPGVDVTITGSGFSSDLAGARAGLQVQLSGPSFAIIPVRTCPNDADPACPAGVVSPSPTSLVAPCRPVSSRRANTSSASSTSTGRPRSPASSSSRDASSSAARPHPADRHVATAASTSLPTPHQ